MDQFFKVLSDYITEHWLKVVTATVFIIAGWVIGQRRLKRQWEKKEFLDRINISLNSIVDGKLLIRTLVEKKAEDIFLNSVAAKQIIAAAADTTAEDPIIPLPKEEYWYYLNSVLNEISERFALGLMKRDIGVEVKSETYLVCLTNECDGDLRTRKIRAMVVLKKLLTKLPKESPTFENPHHLRRWKTLQQLAVSYGKEPHRFLEMEICV